jgi:hypothetical protein
MRQIISEPGNATRYVGLGFLIPPGFENTGQWQIIFPYWGTSYHFHVGTHIAFEYFYEKMGHDHLGRNVNWPDLGEQMKIAAALTGGTAEQVTDETGHLNEKYHAIWLQQHKER